MSEQQIIQYLPSSSYIEFLKAATDGVSGKTHLANIKWEDGIERDSWVKIYTATKPRGLVNEMIGYLLGSALNLPMPPRAGFLCLENKILNQNLVNTLSQVDQYRGFTFAWITEDVKGRNLRVELEENPAHYHIITEYIVTCLRDWDNLANMIAFDDWILNTDRNVGNTIQLPDRTFSLIDHGECLQGGEWQEPQLLDAHCPHIGFGDNLHLRLLYEKNKNNLFSMEDTLAELENAKLLHITALKKVAQEIKMHLTDLIGDEIVETGIEELPNYPVTETVFNFLSNRATAIKKFNERCDTFLSTNSIARPLS
ncbi:hypothetical protein [Acinetobacter puyangensis]|uniref:hypothetical protein n=1 Tax=Acinetobacter puyangensis TaxID=1096779 RepID=UPI003A4D3BD4